MDAHPPRPSAGRLTARRYGSPPPFALPRPPPPKPPPLPLSPLLLPLPPLPLDSAGVDGGWSVAAGAVAVALSAVAVVVATAAMPVEASSAGGGVVFATLGAAGTDFVVVCAFLRTGAGADPSFAVDAEIGATSAVFEVGAGIAPLGNESGTGIDVLAGRSSHMSHGTPARPRAGNVKSPSRNAFRIVGGVPPVERRRTSTSLRLASSVTPSCRPHNRPAGRRAHRG